MGAGISSELQPYVFPLYLMETSWVGGIVVGGQASSPPPLPSDTHAPPIHTPAIRWPHLTQHAPLLPPPPPPQLVIREVAVVDVRYVFTYIKDALAQPASTAVAELPRDALQV